MSSAYDAQIALALEDPLYITDEELCNQAPYLFKEELPAFGQWAFPYWQFMSEEGVLDESEYDDAMMDYQLQNGVRRILLTRHMSKVFKSAFLTLLCPMNR